MTDISKRLRVNARILNMDEAELLLDAADLIDAQRSIITRVGTMLNLSGYEARQNSDNPLEALQHDILEVLKR